MEKTVVEKYVDDPKRMRLFQQERAIVEVTDLLEAELEKAGISRSKFAEKLGKSKGWVTQLLDEEGNKTIRTVADAFAVLGLEFKAYCQPIQISNKPSYSATLNGGTHGRLPVGIHPRLLRIAEDSSAPTLPLQGVIEESA